MTLFELTPSAENIKSGVAVLFVHGLFGDHNDWREVANALSKQHPHTRCFGVDLPGHGQSPFPTELITIDEPLKGFDYCATQLAQSCDALIKQGFTKFVLVGYSLGARLLMYALASGHLRQPQLKKIILEGGNFGLQTRSDKQARQNNDAKWAQRLQLEPAVQVLDAWYQQAVFSHLDSAKRAELVRLRSRNDLESVAAMLMATSLAKQPYLLPSLLEFQSQLQMVVGEQDTKFRNIYQAAGLPQCVVPKAGHNSHKENPQAVADVIAQWL